MYTHNKYVDVTIEAAVLKAKLMYSIKKKEGGGFTHMR